MRSHGLRQLVDDKPVASCQQTCSKLSRTDLMQIVSTDLMQIVSTDLMQIVSTDLMQIVSTDLMQVANCMLAASCQ